MARMLGKSSARFMMCACKRHHTPTISWAKRARHRARAREKAKWRKEIG